MPADQETEKLIEPTVGPIFEALRSQGYAPGNYTGMACMSCSRRGDLRDKRAWRCRTCATTLALADAIASSAPTTTCYECSGPLHGPFCPACNPSSAGEVGSGPEKQVDGIRKEDIDWLWELKRWVPSKDGVTYRVATSVETDRATRILAALSKLPAQPEAKPKWTEEDVAEAGDPDGTGGRLYRLPSSSKGGVRS